MSSYLWYDIINGLHYYNVKVDAKNVRTASSFAFGLHFIPGVHVLTILPIYYHANVSNFILIRGNKGIELSAETEPNLEYNF